MPFEALSLPVNGTLHRYDFVGLTLGNLCGPGAGTHVYQDVYDKSSLLMMMKEMEIKSYLNVHSFELEPFHETFVQNGVKTLPCALQFDLIRCPGGVLAC